MVLQKQNFKHSTNQLIVRNTTARCHSVLNYYSTCVIKSIIDFIIMIGGSIMTKNQIEYWRLKETNRNNREVEKETNRSNLARETETNRNNNLIFGANMANLAETTRSHIANETNTAIANTEQGRHNLAMELLQRQQAQANLMNAQTNRFNALENQRSHLANEMNTSLANAQNAMSNVMDYSIRKSQLEEAGRHNLATESIQQQGNVLRQSELDEQSLHNRVTEYETARHNVEQERENIRSHKASEDNAAANTMIKGYDSVMNKFITFGKIIANKGVRSGLR